MAPRGPTSPPPASAARWRRPAARLVDQDLAVGVTDAYGRVLVAAAHGQSAAAAVETARADRELAGNRRDAGLVTDADVLQLDVYLSRAREQQIQATSDERIARAQLNQLMGEPLGAVFALDRTPPAVAIDADRSRGARSGGARRTGPSDARGAARNSSPARGRTAARAAFLPQVVGAGRLGTERRRLERPRRRAGWSAPSARDQPVPRLRRHRPGSPKRASRRRDAPSNASKAETAARLDVHIAVARLEAARASEAVGRAAVAQARESRRIIRDRYEGGLTDVASLLRAADAVRAGRGPADRGAGGACSPQAAALQRALGRR